jgi:hypothetical protein
LIIYRFTSRLRNFHLYGDVTITGEGLQNLGLCSALSAFELGGIFIFTAVTRDFGFSSFIGYPNDRPIQSPLTTHKRVWRIYSNPYPHGSPFSRLLQHTRGCGGPRIGHIYMKASCRFRIVHIMVPGGREGPQQGKPYLHVFILKKKIFSRTSRPISFKLFINHPWVKMILNCLHKGPCTFQREGNHKNTKMGWVHLNIF